MSGVSRGARRGGGRFALLLAAVTLAGATLAGGCARGPVFVPAGQRRPIDRTLMEYPTGFEVLPMVRGLTSPTAIAVVNEPGEYSGAVLIAERGLRDQRPRIFGVKPDGSTFEIYPRAQRLPIELPFTDRGDVYGPVGGMIVHGGKVYVTHRDAAGRGVVSAFGFDGSRSTVVGDLPARGDYAVTDLAMHPTKGRLYFGVGAATNSGVVGLDNWAAGWIKRYPQFCDVPYFDLKLLGFRFDTSNPQAGLFGGSDRAVTSPFHPFTQSNRTRIRKSPDGKPTSAIYSVSPTGGDLQVEAHGIRAPRGLAFDEYNTLYFTNQGMELRGTRPVKDDPDTLLKHYQFMWYGFPDYSTDLYPVTDRRFQPPPEMIARTGYPELTFLIDHMASGLTSPGSFRSNAVFGVFPALSGAGKMEFVPPDGAFREFRGNAIVVLSGDRAPFATSGRKLIGPLGRKLVRVNVDPDPDKRRVEEFIRNTRGLPASELGKGVEALERPIDVKFAADGTLYVLDMGVLRMDGGREKIVPGTGRLFIVQPATKPEPEPTARAPISPALPLAP